MSKRFLKFSLDLIWSNPIKVGCILASIYAIAYLFIMPSHRYEKVIQRKVLADNTFYVQTVDKEWQKVVDPEDIKGNQLERSTGGVFFLGVLFIAIGYVIGFTYTTDTRAKGWDLCRLIKKHYPEKFKRFIYNGRTWTDVSFYTVNGYLCMVDEDGRSEPNFEAALNRYFSKEYKFKFYDVEQNRIDTLKNIFND